MKSRSLYAFWFRANIAYSQSRRPGDIIDKINKNVAIKVQRLSARQRVARRSAKVFLFVFRTFMAEKKSEKREKVSSPYHNQNQKEIRS